MDERLKSIARLPDGEKMAVVCRQFRISRKTGYKILTRDNEIGLEILTDRSRRPYRHADQLPFQIETRIVRLKQDKPSWGAPKIREQFARLDPDVQTPAISTVKAILDRDGLLQRRRGRRNKAKGTPLSFPAQPNDLWYADYKGEALSASGSGCTSPDDARSYRVVGKVLAITTRRPRAPFRRSAPSGAIGKTRAIAGRGSDARRTATSGNAKAVAGRCQGARARRAACCPKTRALKVGARTFQPVARAPQKPGQAPLDRIGSSARAEPSQLAARTPRSGALHPQEVKREPSPVAALTPAEPPPPAKPRRSQVAARARQPDAPPVVTKPRALRDRRSDFPARRAGTWKGRSRRVT